MQKREVTFTTLKSAVVVGNYDRMIIDRNYVHIPSTISGLGAVEEFASERLVDLFNVKDNEFRIAFSHSDYDIIGVARPEGYLLMMKPKGRYKLILFGYGMYAAPLKELNDKDIWKWLKHQMDFIGDHTIINVNVEPGVYFGRHNF